MELVDKFDDKRRSLNKVTERYEHVKGDYNQSMHIWIQNDNGEFLIQKRSMLKRVFPGAWSVTGGGVDTGETTIDTTVRECKEELGIDIDTSKVQLLMTIKREWDFLDIYLLRENFDINKMTRQVEEVDEIKWATREEIKEMIDKNIFAASVAFYFDLVINIIDRYIDGKVDKKGE